MYQARQCELQYLDSMRSLTEPYIQQAWMDRLQREEVIWRQISPRMELECVVVVDGRKFWVPPEVRAFHPPDLTPVHEKALSLQGIPVREVCTPTQSLPLSEWRCRALTGSWFRKLLDGYLDEALSGRGGSVVLVASFPQIRFWQCFENTQARFLGCAYGLSGWLPEGVWSLKPESSDSKAGAAAANAAGG